MIHEIKVYNANAPRSSSRMKMLVNSRLKDVKFAGLEKMDGGKEF